MRIIDETDLFSQRLLSLLCVAAGITLILYALFFYNKIDKSSPEVIVKQFVTAINANHIEEMKALLDSNLSKSGHEEIIESMLSKPAVGLFFASPSTIHIEGSTATERVGWIYYSQVQDLKVHLTKTFWGWKISDVRI